MPRTRIVNQTPGTVQSPDLSNNDAPKRAKTRAPASVRIREQRGKENLHQGIGLPVQAHTSPILSAVKKSESDMPDYLALLMDQVGAAIRARKWDKLGDLIESISSPDTGLNLPLLSDHPAVKKLLEEAAIGVLAAGLPPSDKQLCRALDLLSIGADWNATDERGNSVLNILRTYADDEVRNFISNEFPAFRHLFIDREGRPIKAD